MKKLVFVLLLTGCSTVTGQFDPLLVAQHLVNDLPCLQASAALAAQITATKSAAPLFGLKAGQTVDATTVLSAIANGTGIQPSIDLVNACQGVLTNIGADVAAIQARASIKPPIVITPVPIK